MLKRNDTLDDALDKAERRYRDSNPRSAARFEEARKHMPGGNTRTVLHYSPFPLAITHAEGSRLHDADGHSYSDFLNEFTAGLFGHLSAMGDDEERGRFLAQVRKACNIGSQMREIGIRPTGGVRIDSSVGVEAWDADPEGNTRRIAETFREAGKIAEDHGEFLVAEGEICWGGMHSWRENVRLLEMVGMPGVVGYQADMAHSMLFVLGANAEKDRILPPDFDWSDTEALDAAYKQVADALRPWTLDFHVAQNDGSTFGSGTHEKTGRHCQIDDPNGRLDVVKHSGYWLRDDSGQLTKKMRHICWDGCMFPNAVMEQQETWNKVLGAMLKVRNAHGWVE